MRLRALEVEQFRRFDQPFRIAGMADGLNLIVGPNEMGKSTLFAALQAVAPASLPAQESAPRLTFGGRGLVSFDVNGTAPWSAGESGDTEYGTVNNFSDSFLLLRLDQQLYEKDRAGLVTGFLFPDAEADLGQVFFNQMNVFYDRQHFRARAGRTRLSNFVLEFPTLREEDLLEYAYLTSGLSNAENSYYGRYGNVLRGEVYALDSRIVAAGQIANRTVTDMEGETLDDFGVNSGSASLVYRLPEMIRYQDVLRRAGVTWVTQQVEAPGQEWMHGVVAGAAVNLTRNPIHNLELRAQGTYNFGVDEPEGPVFDPDSPLPATAPLSEPVGRARAESYGLVGSVRFLSRPYQLRRFQAAVTGAYKEYVDRGGSQLAVVPNVFVRLGQGVDVGRQYRDEQNSDALAAALGHKREHSVQATLSFGFQMMWNSYFGERDDILSMEHGYIP
jgi:energy-coupling factor transporter ATP-binding protein EcfA2